MATRYRFSICGLMLAAALLGSTACSTDPIPSDDSSAGTTTAASTVTTKDSETTAEESSTTSVDPGDGDADTSDGSALSTTWTPPPDHWPAAECDPFLQDCPDGEKCAPFTSIGGAWNANKCVAILGDGQPGAPCIYGGNVEATDDCALGSYCFGVTDVDGEEIGTCTEFCTGTWANPVCPMGLECLIANDESINLCLPTCDPLLQDCAPELACYWAHTVAEFLCILPSTGDISIGESCEFINDCQPALTCWDAQCTSFCSLAAPTCPQMGTECVAFFEDMPPTGYEDVGICIVPGP